MSRPLTVPVKTRRLRPGEEGKRFGARLAQVAPPAVYAPVPGEGRGRASRGGVPAGAFPLVATLGLEPEAKGASLPTDDGRRGQESTALGQMAVIRNQDDGALTSRQQILQRRGGPPHPRL
jgi:hypothetical protein